MDSVHAPEEAGVPLGSVRRWSRLLGLIRLDLPKFNGGFRINLESPITLARKASARCIYSYWWYNENKVTCSLQGDYSILYVYPIYGHKYGQQSTSLRYIIYIYTKYTATMASIVWANMPAMVAN